MRHFAIFTLLSASALLACSSGGGGGGGGGTTGSCEDVSGTWQQAVATCTDGTTIPASTSTITQAECTLTSTSSTGTQHTSSIHGNVVEREVNEDGVTGKCTTTVNGNAATQTCVLNANGQAITCTGTATKVVSNGTGGSGGTGGSATGGTGGSATGGSGGGTPTCDECSTTYCGAESDACLSDSACNGLFQCWANCTDSACDDACAAQNPDAVPKLNAWLGCLESSCSAECY